RLAETDTNIGTCVCVCVNGVGGMGGLSIRVIWAMHCQTGKRETVVMSVLHFSQVENHPRSLS
ncbi:hypothetical protein NE477_26240, partial [Blautia marasmi]|uniref:hypothetical protein n=1 Tax=Blautia marasmi TaxID=1917868 RepID=UPI00210CBB90